MPKKKSRHVHDWVVVAGKSNVSTYIIPEPLEAGPLCILYREVVAWCKKCGVLRYTDDKRDVVFHRPTGDA